MQHCERPATGEETPMSVTTLPTTTRLQAHIRAAIVQLRAAYLVAGELDAEAEFDVRCAIANAETDARQVLTLLDCDGTPTAQALAAQQHAA